MNEQQKAAAIAAGWRWMVESNLSAEDARNELLSRTNWTAEDQAFYETLREEELMSR